MSGQTSHLDRVRDDTAYAEILANWDAAFYAKFTAALRPEVTGGRVLDVGCGVGQVVAQLAADGVDAWGVDVAEANIAKSRAHTDRCLWYDGKRLPFPDRHFAGVGALNVLEHVEAPEDFIADVVRVTAPGGKIVLSSPELMAGRVVAEIGGYPATFHVREFLDCVKTRGRTKGNADAACNAHIACHAANIAIYLGRTVRYDTAKHEFIDDAAANRLRSEALREPWLM
jgi:SAM-dependent methyltransferase